MAKVIGPLMSMEARGSIGKSLSFRNRGYFTTIAQRYIPTKNKKTKKQIKCQKAFSILQKAWNNLTEEEKANWENIIFRSFQANRNPYKAPVKGRNLFFMMNFINVLHGKPIVRNIQHTSYMEIIELVDYYSFLLKDMTTTYILSTKEKIQQFLTSTIALHEDYNFLLKDMMTTYIIPIRRNIYYDLTLTNGTLEVIIITNNFITQIE